MTTDLHIEVIESKELYDSLLSRSIMVNLTQTWEYGEAKARSEDLNIVRLGIFQGGRPVAVSQILVEKMLESGDVGRINRGPVVLSEDWETDDTIAFQSIAIIKDYWVGQKKMSLVIAPNIFAHDSVTNKMAAIGLRPSGMAPRTSINVHLILDKETLRKNLLQKWRNQLNRSERMGLTLEISGDEDGLSFFIDQYELMQERKQFSGLSESFIRQIKGACTDPSHMKVLFAVKDGVRIAAVLIVGFFDKCHYLIGWNSISGMKLYAHNFLIWHGILHFKSCGFRCLDLGGIDQDKYPTITHFKRGVGGSEYTLSGEYEILPDAATC